MKSFGIYTLGCKVNAYESEFVSNELQKAGYGKKDFEEECDIYIINTCTVTNNSDSKSRKMIHQAIHRNPNACIVVMGCFVESHKDYREDKIDILIGNKDKSKIVEYIDEYFHKKESIIKIYEERQELFEDMYIDDFPSHTRAFVKIQDGCDNFCSYCIIPYVRGKCRSKEEQKVIEEITQLVNNGYKEIVLTGIHTGGYGKDLDTSFADLLLKIEQIKGLKRLRISSIECTELNDQVLDVIKKSKIIVDHLHIPLQAGSNEILKKMNRKYDLEYFKNKIKEIRKIRPDIAISTDVIVGFPGETEELFQETIKTCKEISFSKIHVFPYSERKGTASSKMNNKIDNKIKKERSKKLIEVSKELELLYMKKFIGKELTVLIEEQINKDSLGHTSNYLHVLLNELIEPNTLVNVKIKDIEYPYVKAEKKERS